MKLSKIMAIALAVACLLTGCWQEEPPEEPEYVFDEPEPPSVKAAPPPKVPAQPAPTAQAGGDSSFWPSFFIS